MLFNNLEKGRFLLVLMTPKQAQEGLHLVLGHPRSYAAAVQMTGCGLSRHTSPLRPVEDTHQP